MISLPKRQRTFARCDSDIFTRLLALDPAPHVGDMTSADDQAVVFILRGITQCHQGSARHVVFLERVNLSDSDKCSCGVCEQTRRQILLPDVSENHLSGQYRSRGERERTF